MKGEVKYFPLIMFCFQMDYSLLGLLLLGGEKILAYML